MTVVLDGGPAAETAAFHGFPLSPQQRHLHRLDGERRAWGAVLIAGGLDRERLAGALARVVAEHEILRTFYRRLPGMSEPLQVIAEPSAPTWEEAGAPDGDPRSLLEAFRAETTSDGEPLRLRLARLGTERHLLLVALPALSADPRTFDNLAAELARAYAGAPGPEAMQYADFAAWQEEVLASPQAAAHGESWRREELAPLLAPCLGRPAAGTFAPARLRLPPGASHGVPAEATLLAGFRAVLARLSGHTRPLVGVQVDGRDFEELKDALGVFARTLPVAGRVDEDAPFAALVRETARELARARERQDGFTWEALAEQSGRAGETVAPAWVFRSAEAPERHAACPVSFTLADVWVAAEPCELTLTVIHDAAGLSLDLLWDTGRLDEETVRRLGGCLQVLLAQAVASPTAALGDLDLLTGAERDAVLTVPNRTAAVLPGAGLRLHELVMEQARRTPGKMAVRDASGALTHGELDARAAALAQRLQAAGAGPEIRVALCAERSLDMLTGLLAILRTGAAYVPLDPDHPSDRLAAILEEARPAFILAPSPLLNRLPGTWPRLPFEGGGEGLGAAHPKEPSGERPPQDPEAGDTLAYVLYTSGSTGRPKGVMVSHRAIVNRLLWMQAAHPLTPEDRVLQKTPYTFDASIWEIFLPLLTGAELILASPRGHQDAAYLAETAATSAVTILQLVPSQLRLFLDEPAAASCAALRRMFCGGEELAPDLARRFFARFPEAGLVNLYGPTEAAIDATSWPVPAPSPERVPIGRPIANVRVYLANARLQPVPTGAPGELLIAGTGLARGYLGRPDLTAERFIPDPFSGLPGGRLYRTGDLAHRAPGGEVEYLGRIDRQVKVRGVRIEPREIEALLCEHPGVRQAAVMARGEGAERALVAYAVPAEGEAPQPDELRAFLVARLPANMTPGAVVVLRALPLTTSGKVDWNALPAPERGSVPVAGDAPRTPTEELLAGIWAEVLGRDRVGRDENFFDLGGHSLAATQVISRTRKLFGVEVRVQALFDVPTVAGFAVQVERAGQSEMVPPVERVSRDGSLPLSFAQQRLWFLEQLRPGTPLYNIPDAVRFRGRLDVPALAAGLAEVVRRHEALRTAFPTFRGEATQRIDPPGPVPLPLVDLSALPPARRGEEAARRTDEEGARPFDLGRGPLLRAVLFRLGSEDHRVAFTVHHIVSDAWSTGVLTRELAVLYRAARAGEPSPLPELPLQYADFAAWQRRWLEGGALEAQLAWWRERLAGAPPVLDLPADRPRPERPSYRGATRLVLLPAPLTDRLRALGRREGATLFMVVFAAFAVVLRRLAGRDDVVAGTDVANRNHGETEGLIGFFVNQLVLRADLSGDPTFLEVLARVRAAALGAYAHQDVPFETLVDRLQVERSTAQAPLFQVKLFLENTPAGSFEMPGLALERLDTAVHTAKLDLTLALWERPEGLSGWLNYSTDLFDEPRMVRLVRLLTTAATAAAARPDARLSELDDILDELDRRERAGQKAELAKSSFQRFQTLVQKRDRT